MINRHRSTKSKRTYSKVRIQQYLFNAGEPPDEAGGDSPVELEADLQEDSHLMRRHFRHVAQVMRTYYY